MKTALSLISTGILSMGSATAYATECDTSPFQKAENITVVRAEAESPVQSMNQALTLLTKQVGESLVQTQFSSYVDNNESSVSDVTDVLTSAVINQELVKNKQAICSGKIVTWMKYDQRSVRDQLGALHAKSARPFTFPDYLQTLGNGASKEHSVLPVSLIAAAGNFYLRAGEQRIDIPNAELSALISPVSSLGKVSYSPSADKNKPAQLSFKEPGTVSINFCSAYGVCSELFSGPVSSQAPLPLLHYYDTPTTGWFVISGISPSLPTDPRKRFVSLLENAVRIPEETSWLRVTDGSQI